MSVKIKVYNESKVKAVLTQLPDRVNRNVQRKAVNLAMTPYVKAFKRIAPKQSGSLRKSIAKKVKTYKASNTVVGLAGPNTKYVGTVEKKGKSYVVKPFKYAHLVDEGTKAHTITVKQGNRVRVIQHPGATARHIKQAAFEGGKNQSTGIYKSKLAEGAIREAKKLGGK